MSLSAFIATFSNIAMADSMEFGLSGDMVEAVYQIDFGTSYNTQFNYLHTDQDGNKSNTIGAGLFASGVSGRFTTNLGGQLYWMEGSRNSTRSHGLALGGSVEFAITEAFSVGSSLLYSPDIINGGYFESYYDFDVRASFQVMKHASLFVAYRNTEASNGSRDDYDIYKGGELGFKFAL